MKKRLKMKITTMREQTIKFPAAPRPRVYAHCPDCDREVEMLTPAHAAEVLQVSVEMLDHLIASSRVHIIETISGSRLLCKESLLLRQG